MVKKICVSYEVARDATRSAGILSSKEYGKWYKTAGISLPREPENKYKDSWISWPNFLGKEDKGPFVSYEVASKAEIDAGITTNKEYYKWYKTVEISLPSNPHEKYEEWISWPVFFGKDEPVPYNDARNAVIAAGITSNKKYSKWYKSSGIPLPSQPQEYYKNDWISWPVFGGKEDKGPIISYREAMAAVQDAGISTIQEYNNWYKTVEISLPSDPNMKYKEWVSWPVFFGIYNRWTQQGILTFIKSLRPILHTLSPAEQYAILEQGGFLQAAAKFSGNRQLSTLMSDLVNGTNAFDENIDPDSIEDIEIDYTDEDDLLDHSASLDDLEDSTTLPALSVQDTLNTLDLLANSPVKPDEVAVEFLINSRINKLWNTLLNSDEETKTIELNHLYNHQDLKDDYATTFKTRFLEQYTGATNLVTPEGYNFNKGNGIIEPNLMQKFVAYMLMSKKRFGNWSGTGAGKTLGAILASRTINANLTVIIALNNTLARYDSTGKLTGGWAHEIKTAFPNSNVIIKDKNFTLSTTNPNYLLVNYESFQQDNSSNLVNYLLEHTIDMIVLDEVHRTKKRDKTQESHRRIRINTLIKEATNNNPDCHLLAMSATPVINELSEAVSLLEMITNEQYDDLKTKPTIHNALNIHKHLVLNGIRYKPSYETMHITQDTPPINVDSLQLAKQIKELGKQILPVEKLLLEYKLEEITKHCKPGTIVYSHFVDEIFDMLKDHLTNNGFTVGTFNGKDKTGLDLFLNKQVDVLLGSSAIATGVDGLQNVCDKMIIVTLPWTNADFEQLVGRIYRQGSNFKTIEIVIPQLILNTNDISWSWDEQRLGRINYKKTLADSAVDGVIPEGNLMSESELLKESMTALDKWINRIENNDIYSITRDELEIPDMPEDEETIRNRTLTNFSQMNQKINTSNSSTVHQNLLEDPSDFYKYHELYTKARQTWSEIPYKVIAGKLNKRRDWTVADFGCGENLLSKEISNTTYAFDHVAIDDTVTACDMTNTPLKDNQVDVAVFSLSLMSKNWKDYLLEAHRVIKPAGYLFIAETVTHNDNHDYKQAIQDAGFRFCNTTTSQCGTFVYIDAMKPL